MTVVHSGSIVTRSDGQRFLILDAKYNKITPPNGVTKLPSSTKSAQFLIRKTIGEPFYAPPLAQHLTIANIEPFDCAAALNTANHETEIGKEKIIELLEKHQYDKAKALHRQKYIDLIGEEWLKLRIEAYRDAERVAALNEIEEALKQYDFDKAFKLRRNKYSELVDDLSFNPLYNRYKREEIAKNELITQRAQNELESLLKEGRLRDARKKYHGFYSKVVSKAWFNTTRAYYKQQKAQTDLLGLLSNYRFDDATTYYEKNRCSEYLDRAWFDGQVRRYKQIKEESVWENLIGPAQEELKVFNFAAADQKAPTTHYERYLDEKARYVAKWFKEEVFLRDADGNEKPFTLDDEQALAIADFRKNILVAARAGSGKTRTLVAKIVLLIKKYGIPYTDLLVFVFNRRAMEEINARLNNIVIKPKGSSRNEHVVDSDKVAKTFHSFVTDLIYNVCQEKETLGEILSDSEENGPMRTRFIQEIINELPKERLYEFFRKEATEIIDGDENESDVYDYVRNQRYETLDGKTVRSRSEKIICDYLFEHGIEYRYENTIFVKGLSSICVDEESAKWIENFDKDQIKPDFYLPQYGTFWEHWMFNGEEPRDSIEKDLLDVYDEYNKTREWKKKFYSKAWLDGDKLRQNQKLSGTQRIREVASSGPLIETYRPLNMDREAFELSIEAKLKDRGIAIEKRPTAELIDAVWAKQIKRFATMVRSFIDRSEQKYFDDLPKLRDDISKCACNARTRDFLEISLDCYEKYLSYLRRDSLGNSSLDAANSDLTQYEKYGTDFNLLLHYASEIIRRNTDSRVREIINSKKYIIIDEYQDFSELFFELVESIRANCPDLGIFAVGDDWQAINRFAGSDTKFFTNFEQYFGSNSARHSISTNYRCDKAIVENAQKVIHGELNDDSKTRTRKNAEEGTVSIVNPDKVFISYIDDSDDLYKSLAGSKNEAQYLKGCVKIIKKYITSDKKLTKTILILHRKNKFNGETIGEFLKTLKDALYEKYRIARSELDDKISILTMHRSKGLEKDVVIILEADDGVIPMVHQDTSLYALFGETERIVLDDQARLFYVAMTRAKQDLYIMHESQDKAERDGFVKYLQ